MIERYRGGVLARGAVDPSLERDFAGLGACVAEQIDRAELTSALDEIWQRVRRLNRYVEERAPWQLAKDPARAEELDQALASLAEGVRSLSVLLHPYMPSSTAQLLDVLGAPATDYAAATFAATGSGARVGALEPLYPKRV
jgi:methionyl-tRNA synthetase